MAPPKLPIPLLQEAMAAREAHGTDAAAARSLGLDRNTYRNRLDAARRWIAKQQEEAVQEPPAPQEALRITRDVELDSLRRQLRDAQAEKSLHEWAKALILGADSAAQVARPAGWTIEPLKSNNGHAGIPTLLLSDFHWGELVRADEVGGVNEFNLEIARSRLKRVTEKACDLLRHHVVGDYPGIVVCLGGDMVSGDIHEELEQTNEGTVMQQMLDLFEHLQTAIKSLADEFGKVHLPCVTGNHGRSNKRWAAKRRAHLSYEWLLYQFLSRAFANDDRITWQIPDGPDADFDLLGTRYRLTHGDTFRGGDGMIGPLGPITRGTLKRSRMAAAMAQPFDYLLMGHWHTLLWGSQQVTNGTLKGFDEYAQSLSIEPEPPAQALWLTTERHGRTIQLPVYAT